MNENKIMTWLTLVIIILGFKYKMYKNVGCASVVAAKSKLCRREKIDCERITTTLHTIMMTKWCRCWMRYSRNFTHSNALFLLEIIMFAVVIWSLNHQASSSSPSSILFLVDKHWIQWVYCFVAFFPANYILLNIVFTTEC